MKTFIKNQDIPIEYEDISRSYIIPLISGSTVQGLWHCPWCGKKLPKDLHDKYFAIILDELNLEPEWGNIRETPELPDEFKSDAWWKKRKL